MFSNRLPFFLAVAPLLLLSHSLTARASTVLVLQFHNSSQYSDLTWVGESIAETLKDEFSQQGHIVFGRASQAEALRRLSLRPGAEFTTATLIRLGQSLDADYVCYGTYDASLPAGTSELRNSSIQVNAHIVNLKKMHSGPDLAEAGKLVDLSRLEEYLAWQSLRYLNPAFEVPVEQFMAPGKLTRVDAEESYTRGLLSSSKDQKEKWFSQALALDPKFINAAYELAVLALEKKDYRQSITWFQRISASDPRYPEARFKMGLAAYGAGDYSAAANYFREIVKAYPLNEVYNNLGVAEERVHQSNGIDDLRHALDGDPKDPTYLFNLGNALLGNNNFDEAAKRLEAAASHDSSDVETRTLLGKAQRREFNPSPGKPAAEYRLKSNFDVTAFQQLKAVVQPKGS